MWMLAIAAALAAILAVVVLVRRRRRIPPSFLDIWEPLDGRVNPEPTPTRPCDHSGDCKHIVSMWEFNGPQSHPTTLGNVWIGETKPSPEQFAGAQSRQAVPCARCPHAARYHANKGLDHKGKCDPWYTGERCDCPGFEPATLEQFRPFPPPPRAC